MMKKKRAIIAIIGVLVSFSIYFVYLNYSQPKLKFSIEELEHPKENYKQSLTFKTKENSIEINQIVGWAGSYYPRLKKEGNIIKIIFIKDAVSSAISFYNLKATISNLDQGKYKIQLLYEDEECLYEGGQDWERCSKLERRKEIGRRGVFSTSDEFDVEIKGRRS